MKISSRGLLLATALAAGAGATSMVLLSEDDLIDRADLVVHGTVLSSESAYRSGAIHIFTDVVIEVDEVLKGAFADPVLHVAMPGGEMDGKALTISGTPAFHPGERVCVFLVRLPDQSYTTIGISQGKFTLSEDPATGLTTARQAGGGHRVPVNTPGRTTAQALRAAMPAATDWDVFRRRIRDRVGNRGP